MPATVRIDLDGVDRVKKGADDAARAVEPLKLAFAGAERAAQKLSVTALGSFHDIEQQARSLSHIDTSFLDTLDDKWNKLVDDIERGSSATDRWESFFRRVPAATGSASSGMSAVSKSSGAMQGRITQATYAIQDMLSGGAMGGIKGAALGASNNLAVLASSFGGLAGILTSIAVSALPLFLSGAKEAAEETEDFADKLERLMNVASRARNLGGMDFEETAKELEKVNEQLRIALRLQYDQSLSQEERQKAVESAQRLLGEQLGVQRQLGYITERERLDKELANQQDEKQRERLVEQLDAAENARSSLARFEQEEEDKRKQRDAEALSSITTLAGKQNASADDLKESADKLRDRVELIAEAQSDVEREISKSTAELKKLNAEFEKTTDPQKAGKLVDQMDDTTESIEAARSALEKLTQQRGKAEAAAKAEGDAAEDAAQREMRAAQMAEEHKKALAAAREAEIRKREGQVGDQAESLVNQDPRDVARALAEQRTGQTTGKEFQQAFRQAMNQANGGKEAFSQQEIADALTSNAQNQIQTMRQSGQFDQETLAALARATNEQIAQAQELAAMRQQLDAINNAIQANAQNGAVRRAGGR